MEIRNKRVMVLGGWGLVGMAVCRELFREKPTEIVVTSLTEEEARAAVEQLKSEAGDIKFTAAWGNIFVREELNNLARNDLLNIPENRHKLMDDVLSPLSDEILQRATLYRMIVDHKPDAVIDCVNSATGLAYQDIYQASHVLRQKMERPNHDDAVQSETEKLLTTQYVPQLIRHVQVLYEAMKKVGTGSYVKIGTSGTGGMGLNIPYTHSEEKPSRVLLSKSALAGAHTMLLFLMARTPDAPMTKEIKPAAAIAWKRIAYGPIRRGGKPIRLFDMKPEQALKLGDRFQKQNHDAEELGRDLESVFIDTGENGIFSLGEFEAITTTGQMEFVTPEEIARNVLYEIKGGNTGHDVINALDNAIMGPTYRAGSKRKYALEAMRVLIEKHQANSVAFELLGPPRLSKLLFEAHLLKRVQQTMENVLQQSAEALSQQVMEVIRTDAELRTQILSVGIPILLPAGDSVLRGPDVKIPRFFDEDELPLDDDSLENWVINGWVDLRVHNMATWQHRIQGILDYLQGLPEGDTSSRFDWDSSFWHEDEQINEGKLVGWLFATEEQGLRIKD